MLEIFSLFFCFLSFTYKAHCVLWQWIVIDWLGILQKWIHHCPVTECPRTKFRSRSYDSKPSVAPRTPVSWLEKPRSLSYVCQTHALGFKAGSSGCGGARRRGAHARKWLPTGPLTRTAMVCPAVAMYCHPPSRTAMAATVQQATAGKGTLKTSSLLYCDNCTLIGTGLEMTRPAYRLHIVSHEIWPKFPI